MFDIYIYMCVYEFVQRNPIPLITVNHVYIYMYTNMSHYNLLP